MKTTHLPPPTTRLYFSTWSDTDPELAHALWGDPVVTKWIGGPLSEEAIRERLARECELLEESGVQYWPIFLGGTDEHAGCCGLRPYRPSERIYELGFHLRPEFWGRGYATEVARATIDFAFGTLGASALFAGHHPHNTASRRLLEKLGFRYTHDEFYPPTGLEHRSYLLGRDSGFGIRKSAGEYR